MRIAYFVNQYPKVSHTFIRREILALEQLGLEVRRFAVRGWDSEVRGQVDLDEQQRTRHVLNAGATALVLNALRAALSSPSRFWRALRTALELSRGAERGWPYHLMYLVEACTLLAWLRQEQVEHVHAHFGTNSTEVVLLCRLLGGPSYSFTVHGPEEYDKPKALRLDLKAHHARFVVAISSFGRSQLWRWLAHEDWSKVQVVHCALEDEFFAAEETLQVSTAPRLISIGRLCAQKGQLLLVEAAARLQAQGLDFELVLAGDGELRAPIEAAIARHALQARVRITGWIDSATVRRELLAARALVMPSFAEGLPVVIMEAMAVGRPVITTRIAGIPELVRDGQEGWIVTAGDIDSLAEAMRQCLSADGAALDTMGRRGRARVFERHHAATEAGKLRRLFEAR